MMDIKSKEKLHIGYLVPDLAEFERLLPRWQLLRLHNQKKFTVFAYVDDSAAEKYFSEKSFDVNLRTIADMNSDVVVHVIREDKLDILVDISSFKYQKFFNILERKPAKVQGCFVGEFNTTKLNAVDYLFTDKYCDPLSQKADYFVEQLYHLPQTHYCYEKPNKIMTAKKPPFKKNNYVTFASLRNFTRLKDEFLLLWCEILQAVPNSRLLLKSRIFGSGYGCQETRFRLKRLGFPVERVEFFGVNVKDDDLYPKIDVLLGTYPYQDGQETCEAIYHGIPVMSLAGNRHSVRLVYSILKNLSLEECIAFSAESYVEKAVRLVENPYKLINLHRNLPERLVKSALMDERRFIGNVERAYETICQRLVEQKRAKALKIEIRKLLLTVREGLCYIKENLAVQEKGVTVSQMFGDMVIAFENINSTVLGSSGLNEYQGASEDFLQQIKKAHKIYRAGRVDEVEAALKDKLLIAVEHFLRQLK